MKIFLQTPLTKDNILRIKDDVDKHFENAMLKIKAKESEVIRLTFGLDDNKIELPVEKDNWRVVPFTAERLRILWNAMEGVHKCRGLSGPSFTSVVARIKKHPNEEWWRDYLHTIQESDFLSGRSKVKWSASLVWACGPKNMSKVLAGNYSNQEFDYAGKGGQSKKNADLLIAEIWAQEHKPPRVINP